MADKIIRTVFDVIGADKFDRAMRDISQSSKTLNAEMAKAQAQYKLTGDKAEFARAKQEILTSRLDLQKRKLSELKAAHEQSIAKTGENSEASEELARRVAYAEASMSRLQAELKETTADLALQESQLRKTGEKWTATGDKLTQVGDKMAAVGSKLSVTVTAPLLAGAAYAVKAATEFESAFAGVRKTVDATEPELSKMRAEIRRMAKEIPASTESIAAVAESAGQLGIQTPHIMSFTRTMIDMGNATNLSGQQGAETLAKFANITQMSQKDFSRLGSTIVALGNNSATTESDIAAMALRLAGAGKQVGMSEANIMSLAAALSSVGIEADAGGSAMSKVMSHLQLMVETSSGKLSKFARVAGMSAKDFKQAFQEDAAGALALFIRGLGDTQRNGKSAIAVLADLGIKELRVRDALLRATGAGELLNDMLTIGNKAWKENSALTREATERYKTNASQLEIQKNRLKDAAITLGERLLPHVAGLAEALGDLAEQFNQLSPATQKTVINALAFAAALGPVLTVGGKLTGTIGSLASGIGNLMGKLAAKQAIDNATGSFNAMSTSLMGKVGLIGLALALTAAIVEVVRNMDNAANNTRKWRERVEEADRTLENQRASIDATGVVARQLVDDLAQLERKENKSNVEKRQMVLLVDQLNRLMPELNLSINEQTGELSGSTSAIRANIDALQEKMRLEAMQDNLGEKIKVQIDNELKLAEARNNLAEAERNLARAQREQDAARSREGANTIMIDTEVDMAKVRINQLKQEVDGYTKSLAENRQEVDQLKSIYSEAFSGMAEETTAATEIMTENNDNLKNSTSEMLAEMAEDTEEYFEKLIEETIKNHEEMGGILKGGIDQIEITTEEIVNNLSKQTEQYRNWGQNLLKIAKKVPPGVYEELRKLGPAGAQIIKDLDSMSKEELQEVVKTFESHAAAAAEVAEIELKHVPKIYQQKTEEANASVKNQIPGFRMTGEQIGTAMNTGMSNKADALKTTAANMAGGAAASAKSAAAGATAAGQELAAKTKKGIEDNTWMPTEAARALAAAGRQAIAAARSSYEQAGADLANGISSGIRARRWVVVQEAEDTALSAVRRVNNVLMVKSPSRVTMKSGQNFAEGLALGIRQRRQSVVREAELTTKAALEELQGRGALSLTFASPFIGAGLMPGKTVSAPEISIPEADYAAFGRAVAQALDGKISINLKERELGRAVVLR